jgi:nitrogen fixation NifU-like protein
MYNDIIIEHFSNPQHVGDLENADHEFEIGNPVCGDRIKIQLLVSEQAIKKAVFRAWGCATSVATANIFCGSIEGKDANSCLKRTPSDIETMLGELEPSQHHCLNILTELHQQLASKMYVGAA